MGMHKTSEQEPLSNQEGPAPLGEATHEGAVERGGARRGYLRAVQQKAAGPLPGVAVQRYTVAHRDSNSGRSVEVTDTLKPLSDEELLRIARGDFQRVEQLRDRKFDVIYVQGTEREAETVRMLARTLLEERRKEGPKAPTSPLSGQALDRLMDQVPKVLGVGGKQEEEEQVYTHVDDHQIKHTKFSHLSLKQMKENHKEFTGKHAKAAAVFTAEIADDIANQLRRVILKAHAEKTSFVDFGKVIGVDEGVETTCVELYYNGAIGSHMRPKRADLIKGTIATL